ncbi:MAG: flagellar basal-body protein FlbY [Hyphomonadaceae bacterium]|nr:flagellar basal-body protein FlbY [Hyphomonadaceae bacterium]MBX3511238.1 flagellar basal-body protein FlbY [Hyphomonadaceae bacterium]
MALLADDAADRAEQLLLVTERLALLVQEETRRIDARQPPLDGAEAEEKNRLANAYRLELTRIKHDPSLIAAAPPATLARLRANTAALQQSLAQHEIALNAVKTITEGLVEAMAQEIVRQRAGSASYGAGGAVEAGSGPLPAVIDRTA